nr:uncharacterized protein LOC106039485 isoform X2 [Anser cygnoides]
MGQSESVFGLTDASWIVLIFNGPGTYRSPHIKSQGTCADSGAWLHAVMAGNLLCDATLRSKQSRGSYCDPREKGLQTWADFCPPSLIDRSLALVHQLGGWVQCRMVGPATATGTAQTWPMQVRVAAACPAALPPEKPVMLMQHWGLVLLSSSRSQETETLTPISSLEIVIKVGACGWGVA